MTVQTLIFDAYDAYLAAHAQAWPDLANQGVIYDGPQVALPTSQTFAIVGCDDPTIGGLITSVDQGVQDWDSLGAQSRMETFTIWSSLVVWTGDTNVSTGSFPALRTVAKGYVNQLGAVLRSTPHGTGSPTLNDVLNEGGVGWCGLTINRMRVINDPNGPALHIQYSLACEART